MSDKTEKTLADIDALNLTEFGKDLQVQGPFIYVIVYVEDVKENLKRADGSYSALVTPQSIAEHNLKYEKFKNCVGKVFKLGNECFSGRFHGEARCKVGDWVLFPRNEGLQLKYKGFPIQMFYDDRVFGCVTKPEFIERD